MALKKLLLIGDSLTERPEGFPGYLYPLLKHYTLIGSRGVAPVLHEGVGGSTWWDHMTIYESADVPAWCAANGTPDVVHCLLGSNDLALLPPASIPGEVANCVARALIIESRWNAVGATMIVSHLPGPCQYDSSYVHSGQVRADWESTVSMYNAAIDVAFPGRGIGQGTILSDWPVDDCFHPAASGYSRIATNIARHLGELRGRVIA